VRREGYDSIFEILPEEDFVAYLEHNHVKKEDYEGFTALERSYPQDKMEVGREMYIGQMVGLSLSDALK
jgi:hypothetical protein